MASDLIRVYRSWFYYRCEIWFHSQHCSRSRGLLPYNKTRASCLIPLAPLTLLKKVMENLRGVSNRTGKIYSGAESGRCVLPKLPPVCAKNNTQVRFSGLLLVYWAVKENGVFIENSSGSITVSLDSVFNSEIKMEVEWFVWCMCPRCAGRTLNPFEGFCCILRPFPS